MIEGCSASQKTTFANSALLPGGILYCGLAIVCSVAAAYHLRETFLGHIFENYVKDLTNKDTKKKEIMLFGLFGQEEA